VWLHIAFVRVLLNQKHLAKDNEVISKLQARLAAFELKEKESDAEIEFLESITGTNKGFVYKVDKVERLHDQRTQLLEQKYEKAIAVLRRKGRSDVELKERLVFHTCRSEVIPLIAKNGMRPSQCLHCTTDNKHLCNDRGFFGDHTKGVYLSKHADYTFYYQRKRRVQHGDTGKVMQALLVIRHPCGLCTNLRCDENVLCSVVLCCAVLCCVTTGDDVQDGNGKGPTHARNEVGVPARSRFRLPRKPKLLGILCF